MKFVFSVLLLLGMSNLCAQNRSSYSDSVDISQAISNQSGSISFWAQPWKNDASHALISASWGNIPTDGYMVLSDGYWEGNGKQGLYFIVDNQSLAFCFYENYSLPRNQWVFIAVTWDTQHCQITINGEFGTRQAFNITNSKNTSVVNLYSDKFTDGPNNRFFSGVMESLEFSGTVLTDAEIKAEFDATKGNYSNVSTYRFRRYLTQDSTSFIPINEKRVMFDEDILWALSEGNTDTILADLKSQGFNTYIPIVWHGRGAYYPGSGTLIDSRITARINNGEDPLQYLVDEAHKMGIEVHPWFTVVKRELNILPEYASSAITNEFDIHNAPFREFISDLIADVVDRYEVDGVNLDYIRSMTPCSDNACIQANTDTMETLVTLIGTKARAEDPSIEISVDAHPLLQSFLDEGQDSIEWANTGLIDHIYAMHYELDVDVDEIQEAKEMLQNPHALTPLYSVYHIKGPNFLAKPQDVVRDYIYLSRSLWPDSGAAFYHRKRVSSDQNTMLPTVYGISRTKLD